MQVIEESQYKYPEATRILDRLQTEQAISNFWWEYLKREYYKYYVLQAT